MITDFFGRFHPLVVHLPIGIYVLIYLLQYVSPKRIREQKEIFSYMLLFAFVFSVLAVILGWLLADSGDYNEDAVFSHKWSGVLFTVAGAFIYYIHTWSWETSVTRKLYHISLQIVMVLMTITGHFGGNLTHGEDYLFASFTESDRTLEAQSVSRKSPVTDPASATVFGSMVEPILEAKCNQCHNEKKSKGAFRMDDFELLMKGGKHGKSIVPGNAMGSELIKRMFLPLDDDKHMPPKGKKQLTEKEIALIQWWINHGAEKEKKVNLFSGNDTLKPFLTATEKPSRELVDSLPTISQPDSIALLALRKAGFTVNPIATGSGLLHVSSINMTSIDLEKLKLLAPVAKNIYWLELSDRNITDQMVAELGSCINLNRLDLKNTAVTGRISPELFKLKGLEYINLVGTGFDDAGLDALKGAKKLKHIYCWGSKVTSVGVEKFSVMNKAEVNLGVK